ncbi:hypothetical protein THOM_0552 [Trachipleistophora hominis]|uniref:Uncharacterized protein n=1 Tax=Trachipleistophora hominis TaxID=72359 RepID=L7JY95_TRAHO|nr:hypothetical protein THOM_0552 [Trachipleistophora hominis]
MGSIYKFDNKEYTQKITGPDNNDIHVNNEQKVHKTTKKDIGNVLKDNAS